MKLQCERKIIMIYLREIKGRLPFTITQIFHAILVLLAGGARTIPATVTTCQLRALVPELLYGTITASSTPELV